MAEDIDQIINEASSSMKKAVQHLNDELGKIHAGKAKPQMLDGIYVEYYGMNTPLNQIATINTPDAKTIIIKPWEKSMIEPIEKAIQKANIGLNPQNDGEIIRINVPTLTEERRKEMVKHIKQEGENSKISVRNIRQDAKDKVKKLQKEGLSEDDAKKTEDQIQDLTDKSIQKVEETLEQKEEELMKV